MPALTQRSPTDDTTKYTADTVSSNTLFGLETIPEVIVSDFDSPDQQTSTYLTEFTGPDELGEDFGIDPEDTHFVPAEETDDDGFHIGAEDPVFEQIKGDIAKHLQKRRDSVTSETSTDTNESESAHVHFSDHYTCVPFGIQPKATYEHGRKNADIMGMVYNSSHRQFVILDGKGITTWRRQVTTEPRIQRALMYPKYEYRLITYLVYARKYNCYFALGKDFSLKVLNRDFIETCSVDANLRSVLFMLFNPVGDELITGGVGGTRIWTFHQDASKPFTELKQLANYKLSPKRELKDVGGSWVKRVDLDHTLQHLYCCSDTDLYVYDLHGKLLFKFEKAHTMSITGCVYSQFAKTLITCSVDTEVKVWSLRGGLVHSFRGHSRAVTSLLIHPDTSSIVITSSLDGSIRMWSLITMEILYSVVISTDGLLWMGLTDDNILYCATVRNITLWSLNQFYSFYGVARIRVNNLYLASCEDKTTRVVAEGEDSSMRLFSRKNQKNLTTVLPPPNISPLQKVLSSCYSREFNVVFVLIDPNEIWVYTTRTDPSCRVAVWQVHDLQLPYLSKIKSGDKNNPTSGTTSSFQGGPSHRASENGLGNEVDADCYSLCVLNSVAAMWTEEGFCCPIRHTYLLMGLEDGRILFMDPVVKGKKYMEFKASKDAIKEIKHDEGHSALITLCHLKELAMIQIWSLPQLALLHELYCDLDITSYTRLDSTFLTGHKSGCINFTQLEPAEDWGLFKAKAEPSRKEIVKPRRPEHMAEVVAVDASVTMKIFCSCSLNGVIRIWDENQFLLTEIFMDKQQIDENILLDKPKKKSEKEPEDGQKDDDLMKAVQERSLSSACFLNEKADLIIGYKNHVFFIDHSKVCPHLTVPEIEDDMDKESAIFEDPSVLYEGGVFLPEPVTLENYLVPYDIEFSKDFLEGKVDFEDTEEEEDEDSETDSELSFAPSDIYRSPRDSPDSLSNIDLTLDSKVNKYDLRRQMDSTMGNIIKRGSKRHKKQVTVLDNEGLYVSDHETDVEEDMKFDLPEFGDSPGPTPPPTPPSHPATPETIIQHQEPEHEVKGEFVPIDVPDVPDTEPVKEIVEKKPEQKRQESSDEEEPVPEQRNKYRLANIQVDVRGLMRTKVKKVPPPRKTDPSPARSDHTHAKADGDQLLTPEEIIRKREEEEKRLERIKKQMLKERKFPKRGNKPTRAEMLAEQRRLEELKKQHPYGIAPQLKQPPKIPLPDEQKNGQEEKPPEYPLLQYDTGDMESFQDELWNAEPGVKATGLMGTKLDLPPPKKAAAPKPLKTILPPPKTPMKVEPAEEIPALGASPTPDRHLEYPDTAISKGLDEVDKSKLEGLKVEEPMPGRFTPLKGMDENERENLTPDVDTAVRQYNNGYPYERPRSETPSKWFRSETPTLRKLSEMKGAANKSAAKPLKVILPRESDGKLDTFRASPIPEDREDKSLFSDADNELTDDERKRLRINMGKDSGTLLTLEERRHIHHRPYSSFHRKKATDSSAELTRPKTAHVRFQAELELILELPDNLDDLQAAFNEALDKYQSLPGAPAAPSKDKLLYRNDGTTFEDNWQERVIERHMLLRMQKELRARSAAQKRQAWEDQLMEKRQQREMDTQSALGFTSRSDSSMYILSQMERANSFVARPSSSAGRSTAVSVRPRPKTAAANLQRQQLAKTELKAEKPFRHRMNRVPTESPPSRPVSSQKSKEPMISPRMIDPRNPDAIRPATSKSIPSKCNRYILVTKPKSRSSTPMPSPLEEQLLADRFPNLGSKVYQQHSSLALKNRKVTPCIEYTPFVHQWA